ncbi:hypothetical protein [Halorubellus salinus]|uniref:hypothetical protein n=1 Tax=Halorubellus salinus TaxID=755309 RepID=UPI001D08BFE1|nr:hypothetical protein [Halorubellus salinus]
MERRKLLISIGALGTGGAAAFGTEAFTSIEAERNVDVQVAGDSSAYLAFQALDSTNGNDYVTTEDDDTLSITLDGSGGAAGSGVNQDAITQIEDLFKVVNQGTQSTSVYFEDDSDAVTFRVTRSTDTSTNGSNGQSLEGADNSVELDVGEQVVVGLTVDTLNNDVSGGLLDAVTVVADANASAPGQSTPAPQYVVDGSGSQPNTFATLSAALDSSDVSAGSVIGIKGSASITESSQVVVDQSVTITGFNGTPSIDATTFTGDGGAIDIDADDVTLRNFELNYRDLASSGGATNGVEAAGDYSGLTVDGLVVTNVGDLTGQPAINTEKVDDVTITNNDVSGGAIGVNHQKDAASDTVTVTGNTINANPGGSGNVTEGIFVYGEGLSKKTLELAANAVNNQGGSSREILVATSASEMPNSLNGVSGTDAFFRTLLEGNDVNTVSVAGSDGVTVDANGSASNVYAEIQTGVDEAGNGGYVRVKDGTYDSAPVVLDAPGLTIESENGVTPTLDASGAESGMNVEADDVVVRGLNIDSTGVGVSSGEVEGIFVGDPNGFTDSSGVITIEDVSITNVEGTSKSTEGIHVKHYDAGDPIDGLTIRNVDIDGVTSGGAGGNGIKLQADLNNIDVVDTTIRNVTGSWGYGVVLTPASQESGIPTAVNFDGFSINTITGTDYDSVGIGVDSTSGGPSDTDVADPDELSFTGPNTVIQTVDIGIVNKNTNKDYTAPSNVTFRSVGIEVANPTS